MERAASLKLRTNTTEGFGYSALICYLIGTLLVAFALIVPSEQYSLALSGGTKDLSWGPLLFRVLLALHGVAIMFGARWLTNFTRSSESDREALSVDRTTLGILLGLSIVALVLRLWNLNSPPWIDEVLTFVEFARLPFREIVITFPSQNQHMLYSVGAHAAFSLFGESAWALRLPAVLFGVGSIWTLFLFARHIVETREALLAAALMTVSYHHVWFSQNARGYTGLLMFTLLATWAWLEALRRDEWRWWVIYVLAVVAGMWIHTTMAFVVAAHGLVYVGFLIKPSLSGENESTPFERRAGVKPIIAWLLSMTLTLQLYALSLPEFLRTGLHEESRGSGWTSPVWVLMESIQNLSIGFGSVVVVVAGLAFVTFGWLSLFRQNRRAALLMVLPPVLSGGLMLTLGHNLFPRFFFFAMGFGIVIVIHGAIELPKTILGSFAEEAFVKKIGVAFVVLMIGVSFITVPRNYALPKQDFAGAKDYVESQLSTDDKAVAINLAGDMFSRYYAPNWITTRDASYVEELGHQTGDVWLVYTMPFEIEAFTPEMWTLIREDYDVVRSFPGTLNGGDVIVARHRQNQTRR